MLGLIDSPHPFPGFALDFGKLPSVEKKLLELPEPLGAG